MSKTFIFGDIHGCVKELSELFDRVKPDPHEDTLVFLGDYIDRGPDAKGVVDSVLKWTSTFERVVTLKGNHEEAFLDYLHGKNIQFYLGIGGVQTLESYGLNVSEPPSEHQLPEGHLDFFINLLPYSSRRHIKHPVFFSGNAGTQLPEKQYYIPGFVLIGCQYADVGVYVGRLFIIIACGDVRCIPQSFRRAACNQQQLGVHLKVIPSVYNTASRLFQLSSPVYVIRFIEACLELD